MIALIWHSHLIQMHKVCWNKARLKKRTALKTCFVINTNQSNRSGQNLKSFSKSNLKYLSSQNLRVKKTEKWWTWKTTISGNMKPTQIFGMYKPWKWSAHEEWCKPLSLKFKWNTCDHPLASGSFQHDMKRKVFRELLFISEVSGGLWDPLGLLPMKCAHFRSPEWVLKVCVLSTLCLQHSCNLLHGFIVDQKGREGSNVLLISHIHRCIL